ncbi:hypothetical protein LQT97_23355 [Brucella pseudogrignonensis]|jgi:hypothetical protein|nr:MULTISPECIES: hypothetical protein [Brucella]MBK0021347.1 hypothetical protein [Ochrobactrum sp. S45]MBK0041915.1 hypothetical protein [Ochrobactrum sp. S46]ANG96167.1 hypothetical protein A8A54_06455 [Brucella pseudogrignonensis]KAB2691890.1 hypothetical protein F9K82_08215 [Brucella pseudogrignonensis]MCD4514173.1 hypothetical protein [Brucella pseudogrignonensis]
MMLLVFAVLALSLVFAWFGRQSVAIFLAVLCLALGVKQFLWEIYSSEYGYRMPWIQTEVVDQPKQQQFASAFTPSLKSDGAAA